MSHEAGGVAAAAPRAVPSPDEAALVGRLQALMERVESLPDPTQRELAQEILSGVLDLHGEGLRRIGLALDEAGAAGREIKESLVDDGVVASLLLIHDLYPVSLEDRVHTALEQVRPYMESHGGGIEFLALEEGVARVKLSGSCRTCAASTATLETAVREALAQHAPDLAGLDVQGQDVRPDSNGFVPLTLTAPRARENGGR